MAKLDFNTMMLVAKELRRLQTIEKIIRKETIEEKDVIKLLKEIGLPDDKIDSIVEAWKKYKEEKDESVVVSAVAKAFGIPEDIIVAFMATDWLKAIASGLEE